MSWSLPKSFLNRDSTVVLPFSFSRQWSILFPYPTNGMYVPTQCLILQRTAFTQFHPLFLVIACQKGMKQQEQRHSNMRLHPSNLRGGRTPDLPLCSLYEFCFRGSSHTFDVRPMETKGLVQSKYTTRYYKQCQKTQTDLVFALKIIATGVRPV